MALLSMQDAGIRWFTQELCAAGGGLELGELMKRIRRRGVQCNEEVLEKRLCQLCPGRFVLRTHAGGGSEAPQRWVLVASDVRMCPAYPGDCDGLCKQMHLCRYFLYGTCKFTQPRKPCKYSHSIDSPHNMEVLKSHDIEYLKLHELSHILLQNDPNLLPEICAFYNKGDGPHGSCTFKNACVKLHLCLYYLQGNCKFGSSCKRSHVFSHECKEKLKKRGMSTAVISNLLSTYRNAFDIKNESPASEEERRDSGTDSEPSTTKNSEEKDEICLYHIKKSCSFKDKCFKVHFHLPYRWQFLDGNKWKDLEEMEKIEKAFCDPNVIQLITKIHSSPKIVTINFNNMTCDHYKARRLSTASSAIKPPHFIFTTKWLWYWKDEHGLWQEYGVESTRHQAANISSDDLEKIYLRQDSPVQKFSAGHQNYELNFKAMSQKNLLYGTVRNICRRPKFVSSEDVKTKRTCNYKLQVPKDIPSHWDASALPELGFKPITLSSSSEEFQKVQEKFSRTLPQYKINKIERIQNPALWEVYQWQKVQMKKSNGGKEVDERFLFHGTSPMFVDAICHQNFDWRICGRHGTSYGKGSYFARDAAYSHHYGTPTLNSQPMFLARVLVGEFTRGNSSDLRPPAKEGQSNTFYDSCVNSLSDPSIFVIFEKHQIYPEYLIWYCLSK